MADDSRPLLPSTVADLVNPLSPRRAAAPRSTSDRSSADEHPGGAADGGAGGASPGPALGERAPICCCCSDVALWWSPLVYACLMNGGLAIAWAACDDPSEIYDNVDLLSEVRSGARGGWGSMCVCAWGARPRHRCVRARNE